MGFDSHSLFPTHSSYDKWDYKNQQFVGVEITLINFQLLSCIMLTIKSNDQVIQKHLFKTLPSKEGNRAFLKLLLVKNVEWSSSY